MNHRPPAVFAAIDDELRLIYSKTVVDERVHFRPSLITRGLFEQKPCILVRSGIGRSAMSRAVDYCLKNFTPSMSINVGYAGGTTPYMSAGDLLIATSVVDGPSKTSFAPNEKFVASAEKICKEKDLKFAKGSLVTLDQIVKTPHEKAFVGTEHDVMAVDMESFAFVESCTKASHPCIVVRAILDSLDTVIPDLVDVVDDEGKVCIPQIAGHLITNPKEILALPKMEYCAKKAREAIAAFVEAWIASS